MPTLSGNCKSHSRTLFVVGREVRCVGRVPGRLLLSVTSYVWERLGN